MSIETTSLRLDGDLSQPDLPSVSHPESGILVIDKPEGITSFDVIKRVRKLLDIKKVGHCGTLDPFATGVLIVCLDQATRIVDYLLEQDKVYRFTIRFGVETDTLDKTGQVERTYDGPEVSEEDLRNVLHHFTGSCAQQVPRFAAVKIQGRRLYSLTRSGIEVELPKRDIQIHTLDLMAYSWPEATLEARCSKGTYIRQLASDIGNLLGCGAHVAELRRLASGSFKVEDALTLEELTDAVRDGRWQESLISINSALSHLPAIPLPDEKTERQLNNGYLDPQWEAELRERFPEGRTPVRIVARDGNRLVALWWSRLDAEQQRRLRVFRLD
jgi:tRNA pseudouridine55 synthase